MAKSKNILTSYLIIYQILFLFIYNCTNFIHFVTLKLAKLIENMNISSNFEIRIEIMEIIKNKTIKAIIHIPTLFVNDICYKFNHHQFRSFKVTLNEGSVKMSWENYLLFLIEWFKHLKHTIKFEYVSHSTITWRIPENILKFISNPDQIYRNLFNDTFAIFSFHYLIYFLAKISIKLVII